MRTRRVGCYYAAGEPDMLRSGIYLGRGADTARSGAREHDRGQRNTGFRMETRCIGLAPGIARVEHGARQPLPRGVKYGIMEVNIAEILRNFGEIIGNSAPLSERLGKPVRMGDRVVLPVARIRYAFGGGEARDGTAKRRVTGAGAERWWRSPAAWWR